ncbi:PAS-domain containing protein [Primorskyibacter flagellatus]|uniref:histidine kinase n=1 Tax=Primorskyibacter flagellatus TaxID=1387277 RepID=A0A1W1ZHB4_9RHOB|nr:PAS-domain containing protein [Primorskyibacter flagellatus]SMC47471.1 signal transduction histidine kinase [Primorskyibacter flagellatus]
MSLTNPEDSLERQNEKLLKISESLMRRVEYGASHSSAAYAQFERAALLEKQVRERTTQLEKTLDLLHDSNARLAQANLETEAARSNLANAIETVHEGFALFDSDDIMVMCNSRFCRDFVDMLDMLHPGLPFAVYVDRISRSPHLALPEGESSARWAARRIRRHQDRHVMFNAQLTGDRWLQVSEHRTTNGGTVILQTDVTDILRLERQARDRLKDKQAQMIHATLDHLNQGVCIFDEEAQLVGWNFKIGALLSLPARRLHLGASFPVLLAHIDGELAFSKGIDRDGFRDWALSKAHRPPISFEVTHSEGMVLHIFGREMPDRGFVISCTDITAEREAAHRLTEMNEDLEQRVMERTLELEDALNAAERANASKSRFVAAASHDLLQPLSAAKLFISSLADKSAGDSDRAILEKAESALSGAEKIIDALLDISKLESGRISFDVRPMALSEIFRPLRDEMGILAARKGLDLRIVDSSLVVESDPSYLRRILQNLLGNAIRYTSTGRVVMGVRRREGGARIEVWDTGAGIAKHDQNSIFEEFRRLDTTASTNEGLGLGLAIVERACIKLGHPLGLWSEPGRGSCFMVNVPVASLPHHVTSTARPTPRPLRLAQSGLIVLLVENDPALRRAITILIESWGVSVIEATDAASALDLLDDLEITPDALLLDYQLGRGMNGVELYDAITARFGPLPGSIISANRTEPLDQFCMARGLEFLPKPLDRHRLSAVLDAAATSRAQAAEG